MDYKIVVDSSCEIPEELLMRANIESIPFEIEVGGQRILDDETLDTKKLLKIIADSPKCAKTSCPSPERFLNAYKEQDAKRVYAITISSELSGSYNSASLAKKMFEEEYQDKKVHIFDSKGASVAETQILREIIELEEQGLSFENIVDKVEHFRNEMKLFFVLDNLETLRKNGRLSNLKALVASTLNIKPIMIAKEGKIVQIGQTLGIRKALQKIAENVIKVDRESEKRVIISHCNCLERAEILKEMILEKIKDVEILIIEMAGLSSTYANDGGIIVTV